ncbi:MAG: delta-60 repeat domain-containing protein, partial [Ignavibacteriales bacterium]|nr:delta-60 repeat domain-containing protein [Ignavibacteriales bacterium]
IKGQGRNNIAKLNNTDGTPDATWDPSANSNVNTIVIDGTGNYIYTGGSFTTIGGQTRNRIAKLNNTNGNADVTWDPNSDVTVKTIAISGSDIFVGGFFNSIGGLTRNYIAKLNSVNGAAFSDWDPNPMDDVLIISIDGAGVYVGGTFPSINCVKRNFIARFHNSNGKVDNDWDPNSNGAVSTIAISGDDVYVGGIFTEIAGVSRNRIAKLNNIDGDADVTFNPNANNQVINIIFDKTGDTLFVGGSFTLIGTLSRNYIAKLNTTNGNAIATFNPNAGLYVYTIKLDNSGDTLFVGGNFTTIGGQSRNRIAKLNTTNGSADLSWNPNSDGPIYSIEITSNSNDVFAGGIFTSIGGQSRNNIAKLNNTNGDANLSWDANSDEMIARIKIIGNDIFVGGNFTTIGGQSRNYIARLNNTNGDADLSWNPNANGLVTSIESYKNSIYIGGEFIRIGGEPQWYLAKFKNALAIELNLKIFLQGAYR